MAQITPLRADDVPALRRLDYEIVSHTALALDKEVAGLAVTWRLTPQRLAQPFRSSSFAPTPAEWDTLEQHLAAGRREGFVARVDGAPVGFIELEAQTWRQVCFVWNLLLHRPYRGQAIGTALMQAAIAWARRRRLRALGLETQTNNWTALNFYQKLGFELCGIDDHFYTNSDRAVGEVPLFWYYELEEEDDG